MPLTEEARKILSAPVPRSEIKTKVIQGSTIRYTSVQFVERRLEEADPDYEKIVTLGPGGLVVTLRVLGVTRSAAADVPKEIKGFGSPVKNAEAQALKRAAARYGVASELWDREGGEDDDDDDDRPARKSYGSSGSSSKYSGGSKGGSSKGSSGGDGPSAGQIKYLSEVFSVPSSVSKRLTPGREGTASALIDALRALKRDNDDEYEDNPKRFIKQALKKVAPTLVPRLAEAEEEADERDEDEDDED